MLLPVVTVRNVVAERLCFHKRVSRILSMGGVYALYALGQTPPLPSAWWDTHTPGQTPPRQNPLARHPLGRHPLPTACWDMHPHPCPLHAGIQTPYPVHASIHPLGRHMYPLGRHPLPTACWDTHTPAQCMLGYNPLGRHTHPLFRQASYPLHAGIQPPSPRRPLQRTVHILLECILVLLTLWFLCCKMRKNKRREQEIK